MQYDVVLDCYIINKNYLVLGLILRLGNFILFSSKILNFVFKTYTNAVSVQGNNSADFTAPYPNDSFNNSNSVVFCHGFFNTYAEIVTHIKSFNESGVVITVTVGGTSIISPTIFCLWLSL